MEFERNVFEDLYEFAFRSGILDFVIRFLAQYLIFVILLLVVIFLFRERNWRVRAYNISLTLLALVLSRGLITELVKFFYHRARPPVVLSIEPLIAVSDSASFPSGHMTALFALGMAYYFVHRGWGIVFLILSSLVGVSRIIAGVHWPLDILGGALIGIGSAILMKKLLPAPRALL